MGTDPPTSEQSLSVVRLKAGANGPVARIKSALTVSDLQNNCFHRGSLGAAVMNGFGRFCRSINWPNHESSLTNP